MSKTLFFNANIRTMDRDHPVKDWLMVEGGRITLVGTGPPPNAVPEQPTTLVDLAGDTLLPAFCDAHVHLTWVALSLLGPDLAETHDVDSVLRCIEEWRPEVGGSESISAPGRGPGGDWLVADGFDESTWQAPRLPTREELDASVSHRPLLIKRVCGHVGVLNSKALEQVPAGSYVDCASGRIAENDLWRLNDYLRPGADVFSGVLDSVTARLHRHGITSVHDVTSAEMWQALVERRAKDHLPLRISASMPETSFREDAADSNDPARAQAQPGDPYLRLLGVKIFVDGSLGARTAYLRQPYADDSATVGASLVGTQELRDLARAHHEKGRQLMIHAIGDAALDNVLRALEPLNDADNALRHRLEHIEITPPDLVARLARSRLWACLQPNFAGRWSQPGGMNQQRLGERLRHCNAYATLARAGLSIGFGSDCMPLGPLFGLQSAINHPLEAERLEPQAACELYTRQAAYLGFGESQTGVIAPGMAADFVQLSEDPTRAGTLSTIRATFFEGTKVYPRPEHP